MALLSETVALLLFAIVIITSIVLSWYMSSHEKYERSQFHTFISILTGLGIFIVFMFYYNVVALQNQQQQLAFVQELARINDSVINTMLDEINQASTIIPNFILSITPLTNAACCFVGSTGGITSNEMNLICTIPVKQADPINPQTCTQKMVLSYRIFSIWQDLILSNNFSNFDATSYVSNFLQRTNSPQLYAQWLVSKIDFNSKTQQFGDLLFEYGLPITEQIPQSYEIAAQNLLADPRYKAILTG